MTRSVSLSCSRKGLAWSLCVLVLLPTSSLPARATEGEGNPADTAPPAFESQDAVACASEDPPPPAEALFDTPSTTADPDDVPDGTERTSLDRPYWRQNLFGRFFRDQKYLFTAWWPSELRREGFTLPLLGGLVLATGSNQGRYEGTDQQLQSYVQSESRGRTEGVARGLSVLGDAASGAVLIGTGYLIGRWSHNDRLAEASSLSAEALLSAGLWSSFLKLATGRTRPAGGDGGKFFNYHPDRRSTVGSFPSGHATGAFTVATVFAHVYSDHKWVPWVSYGLAGLIAASRVAQGRHFPSDVIVGGVLGNSFGRMVLARTEESGTSSALTPYFDPAREQAGIVWTRDW